MVSPGTMNLVSWWSLNETSGSRADSHGANTLTDNNTVLYAAGKQGNAADFERDATESLSVTDNASLSLVGSLTIAGWIYIESFPTLRCGIAVKHPAVTTTTGYGMYLEVVSGSTYLHFHVGGSSTYQNLRHSTALSTGTWYFVCGQWSDSADTVYLRVNDGATESAAGGVATLGDNAVALSLGGPLSGGQSFDGLMDEMCLYSSVLTADNLEWLYNSASGRAYSELAGGSVAAMQNSYRRRRA